MTREELREHCKKQIQQFERVEKIMPITLNDLKRYEEHKLILELLEQDQKIGIGHQIKHNLKDEDEDFDEDFTFYECSCCGDILEFRCNYCPNCGTKFEGENE